ncbi:sodium:proton exchanger [Priestia megaterium]|nr:sodium:proton exchanger [Priestia megaterium]
MEHLGWISLIPAVIAIVLALISKNVILSLFMGALSGVVILQHGTPITSVQTFIGDYLFFQLTDSYNAGVLVLLVFIGGFVTLMEKSGGAGAFAEKVIHILDTRVKTQVAAWFGGILIFFSDLGTPLIVGPVFEKVFDKMKISREKLAWIIDSTSSPVAVLIPFIGWGVYTMGLIQKEFDALNITNMTDWEAFVGAIPFQFYSILTILMVPLIAITGLDIGPMKKAEDRVKTTGKLYWKTSTPLRKTEAMMEIQQNKSKASFIIVPLLVLFVTLFGILISLGFPFEKVEGSAFRIALTTGYLFATIALMALLVLSKVKKLAEAMDIYFQGMQKMMIVAATLVLAWSLGKVMKEMGTANYIVEVMDGNLPIFLIPSILFAVGAVMSLASGTSWGTFAIMMPLAIPMATQLDAPLLVCIGAVLSGGIFGDHCSPISDTTVLSSTGAGCDHIDHVKTQLPYALVNASSAFVTFLIAGIVGHAATLLVAIMLMIFIVWLLSKRHQQHVTKTISQ